MTDTTVDTLPGHRPRPLHRGRADRRHQGAGRPDRPTLEHPQVRGRARQPGQPPQARRHHRRHRPGRRRRRRDPRRGRLQRQVVLLPGLPAPRALDRRAGRHQRREELQGGRRLRLPPLLRHGQGRRLPLARVERLPPRRGQHQHHRPVRRAGRARSPASTAACSTTAPSAACRSRAPSTPAARPASSCSSAPTRRSSARSPPARSSSSAATRCSRSSSSTARPAASSPATSSPARSRPTSPTPSCSPRGGYGNVFYLSTNAMGSNVTATLARAPQGRLLRQPLLHADPPDLHPGGRRAPEQADPDVGVAAQRRPHLGAEERATTARRTRARSPRRTATTTSSASTPASATSCRATSPRRQAKNVCDEGRGVGPMVGDFRRGVYLDFTDALKRMGAEAVAEKYGNLLDMYAADHGREPVRGADAHLPRRALHDGRPVGRLRPAVDASPACSSPARRTSPTTAPTGSAPRR